MNPFLKAKHWQIFVLLFALPLIIQFWWMDVLLATIPRYGQNPGVTDKVVFSTIIDMIPLIIGVVAVFVALQLGWYFSVALGLRKYTPVRVRLNILPFTVGFLVPFCYFIVFGWFMYQVLTTYSGMPHWFLGNASLLLFTHIIAMICSFYTLYYTAKAYKTALLKRKVERSEVVSEFFMVWFLFIGIWMLQPKINEIIEGEINPEENEPENTDFNTYSN